MNIVFTDKPPQHWDELCQCHGDLFNTPEWQGVLAKGLGSKTLYGWDEASSTGVSITVFKAGPFRIGYLGFPVGGTVGGGTISPAMIEALKKTEFPNMIHCLRIPVSAFDVDVGLPFPAQMTPETAIESLQNWRPEASYKFRRIINKAKNKANRLGFRVVDATTGIEGYKLFHLYRKTILRHSGNMRYSREYFSALVKLSELHNGVRFLLAVEGEDIVGFVVVACHQGNAYCLHSATDPIFKNNRSNDLLFFEIITWAKQHGMENFSFMASPSNQLSLISYKEKWGGETRQQKTFELALHPLQYMMFKTCMLLYQNLSKLTR